MKTTEERIKDFNYLINESSPALHQNIKDTVNYAFTSGFDKGRKSTFAQDSVVEINRQLLLDRSNVGIQKYGVTLEKANLSEEAILQHALEEALDLANYLQTRLMAIRGQLNGNS